MSDRTGDVMEPGEEAGVGGGPSRAGPRPYGQVLAGGVSSSATWPVPLEQLEAQLPKLSYMMGPGVPHKLSGGRLDNT